MRIRENRYEVSSPLIGKARRVLAVSDVHGDAGRMDRILLLVKAEGFDAILMVGDIVDRVDADNDETLSRIEEMTELAPVYFVPGNHEFEGKGDEKVLRGRGRSFLEKVGEIKNCTVFSGDGITTKTLGDNIGVGGVEVPDRVYRAPNKREKEKQTESYMASLRAEGFRGDRFNILISHTPEIFLSPEGLIPKEKYRGLLENVSLVVAGHMHGGLRPRWARGKGENKWGWVGAYKRIIPRNAFGFWGQDDYGLILSDGATKFPNHAPVWGLGRALNRLYIPDVEIIDLIPGERYRLRSKGSRVLG